MNGCTSNIAKRAFPHRGERSPVSMSASIVTMDAYRFPELADISATGAKLKGSPLPPKGARALLRAGGLEILCRVVWAQEGACGVRFEEPVPPRVLKQIETEGGAALEIPRR